MTTQLDLFATARHTDPETSHNAAKVASRKAETNRLLALRMLREHGPMTDFALAELTGIQQTSVGVRRGELVKLGLVRATTLRRPSPSGTPCIVWEAIR